MFIIIPTRWWSLGHCDQHYPQQHTLLETYGQINLSDVQYHSSANNKSNNFVFAECPVIIAITACISAPTMIMIRSIAISTWKVIMSGNWSFDLAAELSSCQIGEIWKKNGRQRNFHKGLKDKIQLNNFATLYKVSAWDTSSQTTWSQWTSIQGKSLQGTTANVASSQREHTAEGTSSQYGTSNQQGIHLRVKGSKAKQNIQPTGHPSSDTSSQRNIQSNGIQLSGHPPFSRGEQEGLFGSREREWELKSTFTS